MWLTINRNKLNNTFIYLALWVLYTSASPFTFIQSIEWHPYKLLIALYLVVFSIIIIAHGKIKTGNYNLIIILMVQMAYGLFAYLFYKHDSYLNLSVQMMAILIIYIFIINFVGIKIITKSVVYLLNLMSVLGITASILAILGLLSPIATHYNLDGRVAYNFGLTYSNFVDFYSNATFIRIAGFFDEPGTLAFFIVFALLLNKLYLNKAAHEVILICAGLLTFSIAFYITFIIYLFLFYFNIRSYKLFIKISLSIIILFSLLFLISADFSDYFQLRIVQRFERSDQVDQLVRGDNRTDLIIISYQAFVDAPLMGQGQDYSKDPSNRFHDQFLGANFMAPLAVHGLVGMSFVFLHVIYLFYLYIKKHRENEVYIKSLIIIAITYLHRPDVIGLFTYLIIILLIMGASNKKFKIGEDSIGSELV